jgi:hypothetical protein
MGERAQTPSDIFLGGENGAVLREQDEIAAGEIVLFILSLTA